MKQLHAITWKENKLFIARALELEVTSQGHSEKEALKNLQEALELYFESGDGSNIAQVEAPKIQNLSINFNA